MTTEHNPFVGDNDHGDAVPPALVQTLESVTRHRDALYAEVLHLQTRVAVLTQERDESRRWCCEQWSIGGAVTGSTMTAQDYAAEIGWDCFKENIND